MSFQPHNPAKMIEDSLKGYYPEMEFKLIETSTGYNAEYDGGRIRVTVLPSLYFVFNQSDKQIFERDFYETSNR